MRKTILALGLAVLVSVTAGAAPDEDYGGYVESIDNGCPVIDDGLEGLGFSPAFMFSKEIPTPGEISWIYMFTESPDAPGAMLLGYDPAQFSRFGCPLIFQPLIELPIVMDGQGAMQMRGRWPEKLPPGFQVFAQAYVLDEGSPTGFWTTNTLMFVVDPIPQ